MNKEQLLEKKKSVSQSVSEGQRDQYKRFKEDIKKEITSPIFDRVRDFTDLSSFLSRVQKTIQTYGGLPVPEKKGLAKRLAQCLNTVEVHKQSLEVYVAIFQREMDLQKDIGENHKIFGDDLALFYSGLFSFYQNSAFEVKVYFMEALVQNFIIKFKKELLLCLPGFMVCILPALEEQNDKLHKKVEEILEETHKIVGTSRFFGEIWKTMLRAPKCRLSAIKYLDKVIPKDEKGASSQKEGVHIANLNLIIGADGKAYVEDDFTTEISQKSQNWKICDIEKRQDLYQQNNAAKSNSAYNYFYYPNRETLVNNALTAGLQLGDNQSNQTLVNRATMDFLISHLPLKVQFLTETEKITLLEQSLKTNTRRDYAFQRKFYSWTQEHLEDETVSDTDPFIQAVKPALKNILKVEEDNTAQNQNEQMSEYAFEVPLRAVQILCEYEETFYYILKDIAVELIEYIQHHDLKISSQSQRQRFDSRLNDIFSLITKEDKSIKSFWQSLGSKLVDQQSDLSTDTKNGTQAVTLISFCIRSLKNQLVVHTERERNLQDEVAVENSDVVKHLNRKKNTKIVLTQMMPIFQSLLNGVLQISLNTEDQEYALPAYINLIDEFLLLMTEEQEQEQVSEEFKDSVKNFNEFYINMVEKFGNQDPSELKKNNERFVTLKKSSEILYKIQRYADLSDFETNPEWFKVILRCSKDKSPNHKRKLLLISIEVFLQIIENKDKKGVLSKLKQLVITKKMYLNQASEQYQNCTDIITTLWSLLNEPGDHDQIVKLLQKFDNNIPILFSGVIAAELQSKNVIEKTKAVEKFSIFWKRTEKDLDYSPFKPAELRKPLKQQQDQNQDNKNEEIQEDSQEKQSAKIDEQSKEILPKVEEKIQAMISKKLHTYEALHNMLKILEDNDPTLRLACRSWLSDSQTVFNRIIDPILYEFIDNNKVYKTFSDQIFFLKSYKPQIVKENFEKLRNIILNTQSEFIEYITQNQISESIQQSFVDNFNHLIPKNELFLCKNFYIQAIVCITLQFITGQAVQSSDSAMFNETKTVNASACEFLMLIMKSIQTKPQLYLQIEIIHLIINHLTKALSQAIQSKNDTQQVHLLNLLHEILLEGNFKHKQFDEMYKDPNHFKDESQKREELKNALKKTVDSLFNLEQQTATDQINFIMCIIEGIKSEKSFVRYQYITFAKKLVNKIKDWNIKDESEKEIIKRFIQCFCQLLKKANVSQYSTHSEKPKIIKEDQDQGESQLSQVTIPKSGKSGQHEWNSLKNLEIDQENEIAQIIEGLKAIAYFYLGISSDYYENSDGMKKKQKNFGQDMQDKKETWAFFTTKQGKFKIDVQESELDFLSAQIQQVLIGLINCWNYTDCFNISDLLFTRLGVLPYTDEDEKKFDAKFEKIKSQPHKTYLKENKLNMIQQSIVDFLQPIAEKFRNQILFGLIEIWLNKSHFKSIGQDLNEGFEKIIQLLLSLSIDPCKIMQSINSYIVFKKYDATKQKKDIFLDKKMKEAACCQSLICSFVQNYFIGLITNKFTIEGFEKKDLYKYVIVFIKLFIHTRQPTTINWLLEILQTISIKFKPLECIADQKLKMEYQEVIFTLFKSATSIIQDNFGVKYKQDYGIENIALSPTVYEMVKRYELGKNRANSEQEPEEEEKDPFGNLTKRDSVETQNNEKKKKLGENVYLKFSSDWLEKNKEIQSHPDSVFKDMDSVNYPSKFDADNYMVKFMKQLNDMLHGIKQKNLENDQENVQKRIFKVFTIVTLRYLLNPLGDVIENFRGEQEKEKYLTIVVSGATNMIQNHIDLLGNGDKEQTEVVAEFLSEFLAHIGSKTGVLRNSHKIDITKMFNEPNFFLLSKRILRNWQKIMCEFCVESANQNVLQEQLEKFNQGGGFFATRQDALRHKTLTFKRLAFLIYSQKTKKTEIGDRQLTELLQKMKDGFKNQEKDDEMRIQLFLLSRILMLRLDPVKLEDALRNLWPLILNELVQAFQSKELIDEKSKELISEAIKIVQLMSELNIEDFQMDQWMFLFDGYGPQMQLKSTRQPEENGLVFAEDADHNLIQIHKKPFQPYMVRFMQAQRQDMHVYQVGEVGKRKDDRTQQFPQRRETVVTDKNDENGMIGNSIKIQKILLESNVERKIFNAEDNEAQIEKDLTRIKKSQINDREKISQADPKCDEYYPNNVGSINRESFDN